jgi:hypothetical protein
MIPVPSGLPIARDRELNEAEREALSAYGADSTFFHLVAQGRTEWVTGRPEFESFMTTGKARRDAIDGLFGVSRLARALSLWSGHGHGWSVRGALEGPPETFRGLTYRYPGFISSSLERSWCEEFLSKRHRSDSRPTLLRLDLPEGFPAIDMHDGGHAGEFEILLPRGRSLTITHAERLGSDVLLLGLAPTA